MSGASWRARRSRVYHTCVRPRFLLLVTAVTACDGPFVPPPPPPPPPPRVAAVVITPDSDTVVAADSVRLGVTLRDSAGDVLTGRTVVWSSDSGAIAFVTQDGWVYAVDSGVTVVRAAVDSAADSGVVRVVPRRLVGAAAGGRHTCGIGNDGDVFCWGSNGAGQLGDTLTVLQANLPFLAAPGGAFRGVSAGGAHTCARTADGVADCWGENQSGQLGRGSLGGADPAPAPVASALRFSALAAGGTFTCGVTTTGGVACWGADGSGPATPAGATPHLLPLEAGATVALAAGGAHACAVEAGGGAFCWGGNADGELGDGDTTAAQAPVAVAGVPGLVAIAAGGAHTCAVDSAGAGWCWGLNDRGQTGSGLADTAVLTPAPVTGGLTFRGVTAGGQFTCGLAADSLAYCWGANDVGQLGDSSHTDRAGPVPVAGAHRFIAISAGARHACGATADHVVWCWGYGVDGELGRPTAASSEFPVRVLLP